VADVPGTRLDPAGGRWKPPPAPPRRRPRRAGRAIVTGVALVALLACLLAGLKLAESAGRKGPGEQGAQGAAPPSTKPPSPTPKPSPVAVDGKLRFTVAKVDCGTKELGDWPLVRRPKGQFCLVDLKVENTGGSTGRLWIGNQKLRDSGGTEYGPDEWSLVYYDKSRPLASDIAPGQAVQGTVVYDVPAGLTFTGLRVRSGLVGGDGSVIKLRS
ncbi:DUF4352 domain-containing protein, partial [Dactylosporangium sp. NPDC051485]|uniref:DUF4352 domain-containing protein n=1 Tax=Dactylosporangium sp. NPDC051485 TaxID=3154846 RepID=UPI003432EFCE